MAEGKKFMGHRTRFRVLYADTDKMGLAWHGHYFRWLEAARTEFFRDLGLSYDNLEKQGVMLPVAEAGIKFISPVRYDRIIEVTTVLDPLVKAGLRFEYQIIDIETNKTLATAFTLHACVDETGRVVRPPESLKKAARLAAQKNLVYA